jgi:hypothetical protein
MLSLMLKLRHCPSGKLLRGARRLVDPVERRFDSLMSERVCRERNDAAKTEKSMELEKRAAMPRTDAK